MTGEATNPAGPFATPRPSMRGRYLIRNRPKMLAIGLMDAILALRPRGDAPLPREPKAILVANWAHLGDMVISMGPLRALRQRYPDARIGMLVGSWGRQAIEGTGLVDDIHVVDHWRLNRSGDELPAKRQRFRETRAIALQEIRAAHYDVAIDLFPFFPPAHVLFFKAGIPVRIGYTSGGFGPLLTHPVRWSDAERPMADQYRDLLDRLTPERPFPAAALRPRREHDTLAAQPADMAGLGPYLVIHPGAGSVTRYWGNDRWEAMMTHLGERPGGCRIVLTGAGAADVALAEELARRFPDAVNMAGRIGWEEFVRVIADAALVICPDTATGHVAALFDVPTVSLFTGTNSPAKWAPYSDHVHVLTRPVACAPCNRLGCEVMACFRGISPTDVAEAALAMLSARVPR